MEIRLKELLSPAFYTLHHKIKRHDYTHYWLKGGRGSTKSSFIALEIILGIMRNKGTNAVCFRKFGVYLKDSVYEQLIWAIDMLGVRKAWKIGISPLRLTYRPTGQVILFRGIDDPAKSKSIKIANGYFAYIWYEEVDEFVCMEEIDTINQSLMRGGDKFWLFYSFNPPRSRNVWVNHEITLPHPSRYIHSSSYLSVPQQWLGEAFIIEAEHIKAVNFDRYRHVYLGEAIGTGGEVFLNVTVREINDDEIRGFDTLRRGIDWGYAGDPFAYEVSHHDSAHKRLFLFYEFYKLNVSNSRAAEEIEKENILNQRVICDNNEPKSVDNMCMDYGIQAVSARKGQGSREHGMKFLAEELEEIIIDPKRCPNAAREFVGYELEADKFGNFKGGYPKKDDHTIDAVRYSLEDDMIGKLKLKPTRQNIW